MRKGATLAGFFFSGGWRLLGSGTAATVPTQINLDVGTTDARAGGVIAAFDNFTVTAGTPQCPAPLPPTPEPPTAGIDYFALGDSIASGHGLMDDQTACRRSKFAYPNVVRALLNARYGDVDFQFKACSGATASKLAVGPKLLAYQISQVLKRRPSTQPTLVTLTIGINDLGWSSIVNMMARLYLDTENQFISFVLKATSNLKIELGRQVARLLATSPVVVVLTTYFNPFNKKSIFCGHTTGLPTRDCYGRTVDALRHVNDAVERVWQRFLATKRVAIVRLPVLFKNRESPRTPCGLAPPHVGQTWVQYRTDPVSNSFPLAARPGGVGKQLLFDALQGVGKWSGDCFHPNRQGASAIGDAVARAAIRLIG